MLPVEQLADLRRLCERLARGAGEIALAGRAESIGAAELGNATKSSATDIATEIYPGFATDLQASSPGSE